MSETEIFGYLLMGVGVVYVLMLAFGLYLAAKYRLPLLGMAAPKNEPPYPAPPRYRR
jgi:hypothetical protein